MIAYVWSINFKTLLDLLYANKQKQNKKKKKQPEKRSNILETRKFSKGPKKFHRPILFL